MEGDAGRLITLIEQDPLILDRRNTTTTPRLETPLHIAAMLGHQAFAAELLNRKPGLARELDSTRSSALHLASANGYVEVVEALLQTAPDMCCVCDRDGKNPLQIAAMMGRIDVLREMLAVGGEAARAVMNRGGNILHLCVEYSQIEALRLLLENVDLHDLVNGRDRSGNTVLHLAVVHKQVEMTEFLVSIPVIDMKAANLSGMTATDILMQRRITDARDLDIEQSLKPNIAPTPFHLNTHNLHHHFPGKKIPNKKKKKKKAKNEEGDWVERKRSALMVAASLIATMAFQFAVTAPQNMWDKTDNSQTSNDVKDAMYYYYVRKAADYLKGEKFYAINTTSFIASLSIILLLMSGLPLNNRVVVWTLMMITWIAISAIALSYTVAVVSQTTPASNKKSVYTLVAITVFVWICLVTLLLLGHTVRLFVKMVKILVSSLSVRRRQYPASAATRV